MLFHRESNAYFSVIKFTPKKLAFIFEPRKWTDSFNTFDYFNSEKCLFYYAFFVLLV